MFRVSDYMTPEPVTLKEDDDLALADTILKLGRIRHLPVVRDGKLVGLVTHRDVLRACGDAARALGQAIRARDVMVQQVETAQPNMSLRKAAKVLLRQKYGCLPVVGEGRKLLGIITEADLVRFAVELLDDLDKVDDRMPEVIAQALVEEAAH